ncbi:3-isopropylmalate dehydratase large subunit [Acetobacter cerevisiae]|uniref:3-isopropylmalate dehydratase large subunit n=1 Tax=Acetobacter cerevisiae TaxID=178900 RepID=A0ABT1EV23_9PROT|nr:3-isopropylmalate dehydratase large subunit [Acetobacter cerevisiae]MCP1247213.1 3-isopropylmalate dehydratase large subunit [Acetobacter cerevisiae]MCP1256716.1 3-isopropylmalate dehydratase large subunit [Acetobacter cerevisiae]
MTAPRTLYEKIVDSHNVLTLSGEGRDATILLYIDRTVLNEYTSPQAFSGLRENGRKAWRPQAALGVVDHVNSTAPLRTNHVDDADAQKQIDYFATNGKDFNIEMFDVLDARQGIEHVVLPELGLVQPGMVIAAGDSHTTTYGAFGSIGFGIGTSDIEHLLATQTLPYKPLKNMRATVRGQTPAGVAAKDIIMHLIRTIGADGADSHALELDGDAIQALDVEERMTICNMAVECGARVALVAPDAKVYAYVSGRPRAPSPELLERAQASWAELYSDPDAHFDREVVIDASDIAPTVTWGTSPDQAASIDQATPYPHEMPQAKQADVARALTYMGLAPGLPLVDVKIDHAFIGSCTNGRISDLRDAARVLKGRQIADGVRAIVSPGSSSVRRQAEAEGLDRIFKDAGFEWRQSGCSMCLAMNDDVLNAGERCASSTNRNFEGRQGSGGRTHLMSPAMVAAAAVVGRLTDVRKLPALEI